MKCIREASHGVSHGWIRVCGPTPPCRPQAGGGAEARAQRAGGEPACLAWGCRQIKGGQSAQEAGRARALPHSVWHPTGLLVPLSPSCPVRTPVGWRVGLRVGLVGNPPWRPGLLFLPASPTPLAPPPVGTSMPVGAAKPSQAKPHFWPALTSRTSAPIRAMYLRHPAAQAVNHHPPAQGCRKQVVGSNDSPMQPF